MAATTSWARRTRRRWMRARRIPARPTNNRRKPRKTLADRGLPVFWYRPLDLPKLDVPIEVELATKLLAEKLLGFIAIAYAGLSFLLWLLQWWWSGDTFFMGLVESSIHLLLLPSLFL